MPNDLVAIEKQAEPWRRPGGINLTGIAAALGIPREAGPFLVEEKRFLPFTGPAAGAATTRRDAITPGVRAPVGRSPRLTDQEAVACH